MGFMLAIFCVVFTSCGHEVEDMDPVSTMTVDDGTIDIDVRGEDPEENDEGDPSNSGSGSGKQGV